MGYAPHVDAVVYFDRTVNVGIVLEERGVFLRGCCFGRERCFVVDDTGICQCIVFVDA